jgi:SAM-dependent methyltransferase
VLQVVAIVTTFTHLRFTWSGDTGRCAAGRFELPVAPRPEPGRRRHGPPTYDLSYRDAFWAARAYEDLCDRIALPSLLAGRGGQVLDVGARFGRLIDEQGGFGHVTLVDASSAMIETARERVGSSPLSRLCTEEQP